jgi:hypothetical protein
MYAFIKMSSNRLLYDTCEYKQKLRQNDSSLDFVLDPIKFEHAKKCRNEFGLLGGTNVSHVKGNLVDLENDLRGQTRPISSCSEYLHKPQEGNFIQSKNPYKCQKNPRIDTSLEHLPSCQMIDYAAIPRGVVRTPKSYQQ